jgi:hypothetical protein
MRSCETLLSLVTVGVHSEGKCDSGIGLCEEADLQKDRAFEGKMFETFFLRNYEYRNVVN